MSFRAPVRVRGEYLTSLVLPHAIWTGRYHLRLNIRMLCIVEMRVIGTKRGIVDTAWRMKGRNSGARCKCCAGQVGGIDCNLDFCVSQLLYVPDHKLDSATPMPVAAMTASGATHAPRSGSSSGSGSGSGSNGSGNGSLSLSACDAGGRSCVLSGGARADFNLRAGAGACGGLGLHLCFVARARAGARNGDGGLFLGSCSCSWSLSLTPVGPIVGVSPVSDPTAP